MRTTAVILKRRPNGRPDLQDFALETRTLAEPDPGQVLVRTLSLSVDPYMRARMNPGGSYMPAYELDAPMSGHFVGEVVSSLDPRVPIGSVVAAVGDWQEYVVLSGGQVELLPDREPSPDIYLGPLGMVGHTAYVGLLDIGRPVAGETVVVSAAAGAVGSLVGQIAKLKGCRAVGIAGGPEKCRYVVDVLGFDACVDYRATDFPDTLQAACPNGIDIDFENVGGDILGAVWPLLNNNARIAVCGLIADYNQEAPSPAPPLVDLLTKRVTMHGFLIMDHADRLADFRRDMRRWLETGALSLRSHVVRGLERAPEALIGLFSGDNLGKSIVQVADRREAPAQP
ncbi:NADP-dependent oxidoreductase [Nocardia sp. SC052]|uniref:NADP-dependent oxidoreductase n=1 Tax=Nocardia sichangensis TaxID=3385975 RepID=UPI0039A156EE